MQDHHVKMSHARYVRKPQSLAMNADREKPGAPVRQSLLDLSKYRTRTQLLSGSRNSEARCGECLTFGPSLASPGPLAEIGLPRTYILPVGCPAGRRQDTESMLESAELESAESGGMANGAVGRSAVEPVQPARGDDSGRKDESLSAEEPRKDPDSTANHVDERSNGITHPVPMAASDAPTGAHGGHEQGVVIVFMCADPECLIWLCISLCCAV